VVLGFFVQLSLGLFYTYVPDVLPDRFATAGVALLTSVSLGGAFSAPLVAGFLIDRSGAYVTAFSYAVVLAVAGTVLALFLVDVDR
jgi:MFS family permease